MNNSKDQYEYIRGGFPRIKIKNNYLVKKQEQGFAGVYSINDILKTKKSQQLILNTNDDELHIVGDRTINGIDIDIFAKP